MTDDHLIRLTVNGSEHVLAVEPRASLADVLRDDLGHTGTNVTCEQGICGACTVLVDGQATRACLVFAVQADDSHVETVESLGTADRLSALQQAFREERAVQCGFCTPGFLMLATWLLREQPDVDDQGLREVLGSNICRCTGYRGILRAVARVRDSGEPVS
ncbi:(2Fe-2S)-binding protein [Amycolatopsis jejuensis]|uniref:(2Fe-2S)-binding protein n=1 Tax=Amycolatopsis jejuensis TaxID=330084 RepID=UPI0005263923|nr:(2Fe-2S)-binding protein [Amycolatopsis jejuensis]